MRGFFTYPFPRLFYPHPLPEGKGELNVYGQNTAGGRTVTFLQGEFMNYSEILDALNQASLFDSYRLSVAINHELDNPQRLENVKRQLSVGMTIWYFDSESNKQIEARITEIRRTRVSAVNKHDGRSWNLPLYLLNLAGVDTEIHASPRQTGLTKNQLSIGERVGFFCHRENREVYGEVQKLNPKTISLLEYRPSGTIRWKVSYSLLFKVIEGEAGGQTYLPAR
jgi:hypothetical protein